MANSENSDFENLKEITSQEENSKEDIIVLSLLCEEEVSGVEAKIDDLILLEEETENNRCLQKVQKVIETTPLKCNGSKVGNAIIAGIAEKLLPKLETNIREGLEDVKLENLQEMVLKLQFVMGNRQVSEEYKGEIAGSLVKILNAINERNLE